METDWRKRLRCARDGRVGGWSGMLVLFRLLLCLLPLLGGCDDGPPAPTSPSQPTPPLTFVVPPGTLPSTRPEAHRTDFLTLPGVRSTLLLPGQLHLLGSTLMTLQARGYTDIYLYVVNEGDFGGSVTFNWYEDPQGYREILEAVVRAGIRPVVWLAPDDAPGFHRNSANRLPTLWQTFIPAIDDLVGSYVLGLELKSIGPGRSSLPWHAPCAPASPCLSTSRAGAANPSRATGLASGRPGSSINTTRKQPTVSGVRPKRLWERWPGLAKWSLRGNLTLGFLRVPPEPSGMSPSITGPSATGTVARGELAASRSIEACGHQNEQT